MTPPLLEMLDVDLAVDGRRLLDGINLTAHERRIGIVGRNGSGKTTLSRVMAGLVKPDSGRVRVGGVNVGDDRKAAIRQVGILFQNPDHQIIFPTVEEEIAFGLGQLGHDKQAVAEGTSAMLARFDKSHWAKAAVHTLSQGQKQLVCLMAVLAMAPRVIILDEPLSGLDIPTRMQLTRYLDGIEATLVHVSHDPAALAGFERVIWLSDGRIAQDGPADDVLPAFTTKMTELGGADDISDIAG
ncbi:energy-coupling factor ABC transporter ATP-binding protein [Roseovarius pelagicus]|uniref:Energy-coupling factor ABC transporter ATP-binding protein n=1 Tax=Roseovarius pelagicus TaxID=2980108 RepID=A0ABY6D8B4_9RHOB|nr:ABC transporter ATP-binding protein [Roseovarius pelagicus]UXX82174.1 energy-coupling factor ABC transporter ATP-binding protein [Roseovarius pelagicus]